MHRFLQNSDISYKRIQFSILSPGLQGGTFIFSQKGFYPPAFGSRLFPEVRSMYSVGELEVYRRNTVEK